jgi:hypothetical protein
MRFQHVELNFAIELRLRYHGWIRHKTVSSSTHVVQDKFHKKSAVSLTGKEYSGRK